MIIYEILQTTKREVQTGACKVTKRLVNEKTKEYGSVRNLGGYDKQ